MEQTQTLDRSQTLRKRSLIERIVTNWRRLGFTDIYHDNVQRRGLFGEAFILLCGTPHIGVFANGLYLKRALKLQKVSSVLDAGCGDGTFAFYAASHLPNAQVTGVDIGEQGLHSVDSTLDICRRIHKNVPLPNLQFQQLDLRNLSATNTYDFIYCFDVLEHIPENKQVLRNIHGALQKGGLFLFRIPSRVQRRILSSRFTAEHAKWAEIEHLGQHYEMDTLLADLKEIGYNIKFARFTNALWGRLSFELLEAMRYWRIPEFLQFGCTPFLKFLRWLDTHGNPKEGDGLLVLCQK
jgi:2-polyprenyl-3-methyl-5-hydroxy-6-metoxy-1,4-benzoquinol methylase